MAVASYWQANNITLASAGRIQVRPVSPWMDRVGQYRWESTLTAEGQRTKRGGQRYPSTVAGLLDTERA